MPNLILKRGTLATMPSTITNGTFRVATDVKKLFVDIDDARLPISDLIIDKTEAQIKAQAVADILPKVYVSTDTFKLFWYDSTGAAWKVVGGDDVNSAVKDGSGNTITTTYETKADAATEYAAIRTLIAGMNSFEIRKIDSIANAPTPGASNVIYFVLNNAISTNPDKNTYDEYIWIVDTAAVVDPDTEEVTTPASGHYELIGTTETDLTNYYTKTEEDTIVDKIWATLGLSKASTDPTATGFASIDSRLTSLVTADTEINAKIGADYPASTSQGFQSVNTRLTTEEGNVDEIQAQLGSYAASTDTDFVSVADRFTADESDIAELTAQIGNLDSTATGYQTIDERLTALETDTTDSTAITELEAKFGAYADSTDTGFVTVENRFTADEADIAEINAKIGNMAASTTTNFKTIEERLSDEETATARFDAELGTLDSTASDYVTVADRLDTLETDDAELKAQIGTLDSTATGYVTIADRLDAEETATARLDAELGTLDSTATGYQTVASRLSTNESDIDEVEAQLGSYPASTDTNFVSVADRFTSDEAAITEINAKLGISGASTDTGFQTVDARLNALANAVGNINRFEIQFVDSLPATTAGESYVLYFVKNDWTDANATNSGKTKYTEYMWVKTSGDGEPVDGYYEEIGVTEADLGEYYTSAQTDSLLNTERARTTKLEGILAGSALATEDPTATGYTPVLSRVSTAESDIAELKAEIGTLDSTATGYVTIDGRLTTEEGNVDELQAKFGAYLDSTDTDFVSVEDRFAAIETATGQAEDTANAAKPMLVSGNNSHNTVEYVADITANASTGTLAATNVTASNNVTANALVLGDATLTFNSTTGALEINF